MTSPPYWGTRDYHVENQIGISDTVDTYLSELVGVFEQVRSVLRDDGVMWLNIGDVFASGNRTYRAPDSRYPHRAMATRPPTPAGLKPKDLIGIPWRLAFALQASGWYLRTEIIWHKTNAMPESVRDRPSRCHEYLFMFSKSLKYEFSKIDLEKDNGSSRRSVWQIPTVRSSNAAHHAAFPLNLILPCITSSTAKGGLVLDPFAGTGTVGVACGKCDRGFLGIELNPRFAHAAVSRLGCNAQWLRISKPKKDKTASVSKNGKKRRFRV